MIIFERVIAELGMQDGCITPLIGLAAILLVVGYIWSQMQPGRPGKTGGYVYGQVGNAWLVEADSRAMIEDKSGMHIARVSGKTGLYAVSPDWAAAQALAAHPEQAKEPDGYYLYRGTYTPDRTGALQRMMEGSEHDHFSSKKDKSHAVDRSVDAMRRSISLSRGGLPFGFHGNENNPQHVAEYVNALFDAGFEDEARAVAQANRKTLRKGGRNG